MPTLSALRLFARYHLVRRVAFYPARDTGLDAAPLGYDARSFAREIMGFGEDFDVRELDERTFRGVRYPIFSVATRPDAPRRILVLSGVHGNEEAGILAVPELLARLRGERALLERVSVHFVTPVNPVGAAEGSRLNADGYDVNRDFKEFLTPEARAVGRVVDAVRPEVIVSLHEGPQDAAFFFANERVPRALGRRLLTELARTGVRLATHDYFGARLPTPGLSPSTWAGRALHDLWATTLGMMPTSEYAARRGIAEITLESGWRSPDRRERLRPHVELVLALLRALAHPTSVSNPSR